MDTQISPNAFTVASQSISKGQKVIITGSTGWFGRTALDVFQKLEAEILLVGRKDAEVSIGKKNFFQHNWDEALVRKFQPEIVIDTAFLTKDKLSETGFEAYINANREIMSRSYELAKLDSVKAYIGFSSGAAVTIQENSKLNDDPYGFLKKEFEEKMRHVSNISDGNISVIRPWSVAGPNLTKPDLFAFSNLIMQSRTGVININSSRQVWRRYCSLEDLIVAGLALVKTEKFHLLESGGELIEIEELALRISKVLGYDTVISRRLEANTQPDRYYSDDKSWSNALRDSRLKPKSLDAIIREVDSWLPRITR